MFDRLFLEHPRQIGESYGAHARTAARFGWIMVVGGLACIVHAVVPALFVRSASRRVKQLYGEMLARQPAMSRREPAYASADWQINYEI